MADLLSVDTVLERLITAILPVQETQSLATIDASGRVLAKAVTAAIDVPTHDNTQMDGYAVRVSDCREVGIRLPVSQRIPAGHIAAPLAPHSAARIFTGGLIPSGADTVVMQEDTRAIQSAGADFVSIEVLPASGQWIRRAGEDVRAGTTVLAAGTRLAAQHLGLAASLGNAELCVYRRVRVAVFFTGDELAMPGAPLAPGQIYNSNRFALNALVGSLGCEVIDLGIVPDSLDATRAALRSAAASADCIITCGGMSVGEEDHVRAALQAEGRLDLWQIAMKPGKPFAFGRLGESWFLGLPGNPVASFITFLVFGRPALLRLAGVVEVAAQSYRMRADFDWQKPDAREEFLRVRINADGGLDVFGHQGSAVLSSTVWADGLVRNRPRTVIRRGEMVEFLPFDALGAR